MLHSKISNGVKRPIANLFLVAVVILLDQVSKYLIPQNQITKNPGLILGIDLPGFFDFWVVLVLLLLFVFFYLQARGADLVFVLIVSGAVSNLVDRALIGFVRDWIDIGISKMNIADIAVWAGIILLIFRTSPGLWPPSPGVGEGLGERS